MNFRAELATMVILSWYSTACTALEVSDQFSSKVYSARVWNDCQANWDLLNFGTDGARMFLINKINSTQGNTECSKLELQDENLGPSFFVTKAEPSCPVAEKVFQRNELRPRAGSSPARKTHWYSMTFKLRGADGYEIPKCGSNRWVNAQWKFDDVDESPFLAQRFDNGVLHVTLEHKTCRCMIASAKGDPDKTLLQKRVQRGWNPVRPLRCYFNTEEGQSNKAKECKPEGLRLFVFNRNTIPLLPAPIENPKDHKLNWVRMTYRVRADVTRGIQFDLFANGQFIVRASDVLPNGADPMGTVKFKFGHYRDKVVSSAELLVDRVCISRHVKNCDRSVTPMDE